MFKSDTITCQQGKDRCPYVAGFGVGYVPKTDVKVNYLSGQVYAYTTKAISFLGRFSYQIIFTCQITRYCNKAYCELPLFCS